MIFAIGWFIAIFLHLSSLKRTTLHNTKELIIEEIYLLIAQYKEGSDKRDKQIAFAHKSSRIENKIKEINSLYNGELISLKKNKIKSIFLFDSEKGELNELSETCYDAIEYIETRFHYKIQYTLSPFYLIRYEVAGFSSALIGLYCLMKIMYFLYK